MLEWVERLIRRSMVERERKGLFLENSMTHSYGATILVAGTASVYRHFIRMNEVWQRRSVPIRCSEVIDQIGTSLNFTLWWSLITTIETIL
ncbi:hypothetical protein J6590_080395 [Homalodisca vitripennis]|nr:hypothetical protein J6590_080395 [Homalodisca vitripennis]